MSTSINEKQYIVNLVFLSEIAEKHQGQLFILDGKTSTRKNSVIRGSTAAYSQNLSKSI